MEDRLIRIESKLDNVSEKIGDINSTLAAQHVSLEVHIKRTELLEAQIEPIKKHVAMVQGALKLIGLMSIGAGMIEGVVALLTYMKGMR